MLKKIIFFLIVLNSALALWFFRGFFVDFFSKTEKSTIETSPPESSLITENESKNESKEEIIVEKFIIATGDIKAVSKIDENKIIYYNQNNFLETDLAGSYKKTLGSYPFNQIKTVKCSKTGKFCIVWAGEKFSVYDLTLKQNTELVINTKGVNFNSLEDGLVYLFSKNGSYELNSSDLDGKNWVQLKTIKGEKVDISISPQDNKIAYFSRKVSEKESGIFLTDLAIQESTKKIVEKDIIDVLWAPTGTKLLFSFYDHSVSPKRVQLGYYDLNQNREYELGLPGIAQKCVWSENAGYLYCAALTSISPRTFELDDWYSRTFVSHDIFWKIDLNESKKEKIFDKTETYPSVDSFNLILIKNELIFIDKISGNLIKREI